jgi:hypothetical protein
LPADGLNEPALGETHGIGTADHDMVEDADVDDV